MMNQTLVPMNFKCNILGQFKNLTYICNMKKGDKIIDKRDGVTHEIESVESFGDITVIFTESSKCIPIGLVKPISEMINKIKNIFDKLIKPTNKKVRTAEEWFNDNPLYIKI